VKKLLILFLFIVVYFAARIPMYPQKMRGEDGGFAAIPTKLPTLPKYMITARVENKDIFSHINHPALNYEILKIVGVVTPLSSKWTQLSPYWLTTWCRVCFSLYELVFFLALLCLLLFSSSFPSRSIKNWTLVTLFIYAISPLAVSTSTWLQLDNTAGVVTSGFFALVLLWGVEHSKSKMFLPLLFLSSMVGAFGKNEWGLMLLISLFFVWAVLLFFPQIIEIEKKKTLHKILLIAVIGCIFGHLINWLYGPKNYTGGMTFMLAGGPGAVGSMSEKITRFIVFTVRRFPILLNLVFALGFSVYVLWKKRKPVNFFVLILLVYSAGLFSMFFFSLAFPITRYFTPSFVVAMAALIAICQEGLSEKNKKIWRGVLIFTVLHMLSSTLHRSVETFAFHYVDGYHEQPIPQGCVPFLDGQWMIRGVDYVFEGLPEYGAQDMVDENSPHHLKVCPKPPPAG